jgi:replication factor A1
VQVAATLLEVRPGSGLVMRCSTAGCSRVLANGMCRLHNRVEGVPDLRVKAILDDGTGALSAIIGRELTETLLGKKLDQCVKEAQAAFRPEIILDQLKEKLTARVYVARGNVMSDEYGPTMIVRGLTAYAEPKEEAATQLLASLEVA